MNSILVWIILIGIIGFIAYGVLVLIEYNLIGDQCKAFSKQVYYNNYSNGQVSPYEVCMKQNGYDVTEYESYNPFEAEFPYWNNTNVWVRE